MTSAEIEILYEKYMEVLLLEIEKFKSQPTEARHLIGRLGEFHCAIETGGELAKQTNQHGYDVLCNGRRISVKTTAQKNGFVAISKKTLSQADDLMIIQLDGRELKVIYYNSTENLSGILRPYGSNYEFDISFAKRLSSIGNLEINDSHEVFTSRLKGNTFLKISCARESDENIFYKFSKNNWSLVDNRIVEVSNNPDLYWNLFKQKKY